MKDGKDFGAMVSYLDQMIIKKSITLQLVHNSGQKSAIEAKSDAFYGEDKQEIPQGSLENNVLRAASAGENTERTTRHQSLHTRSQVQRPSSGFILNLGRVMS